MLNRHSIDSTDADAQEGLLGFFRDNLGRHSFKYTGLNDAVRPIYEIAHGMAYEFARAYCHKSGRAQHLKKIAIDYYADTAFQATAYTKHDTHFIAVSAGVPVLLLTLFFEVFKYTNPFAATYSSANEEDNEPGDYRFPLRLPTQSDTPSLELAELINQTVQETVPPLRWQRIWATRMAELAMLFVFAHELSHVVRGHTSVLGTHHRSQLMEVTAHNPREAVLFRLRHAWEVEADETAFAFLWSYLFSNKKIRGHLVKQLRCARGDHPEVTLISRLIYAASFMFFLLGQTQQQVDAVSTHPSALVRITYLMAYAQGALEHVFPGLSPSLVEQQIQSAHTQAEAAWNRLGLEFGKDSYQETRDDLPQAVARMTRRRDRVARAFGSYAWALQSRQG
jgi:hypothetical protein